MEALPKLLCGLPIEIVERFTYLPDVLLDALFVSREVFFEFVLKEFRLLPGALPDSLGADLSYFLLEQTDSLHQSLQLFVVLCVFGYEVRLELPQSVEVGRVGREYILKAFKNPLEVRIHISEPPFVKFVKHLPVLARETHEDTLDQPLCLIDVAILRLFLLVVHVLV